MISLEATHINTVRTLVIALIDDLPEPKYELHPLYTLCSSSVLRQNYRYLASGFENDYDNDEASPVYMLNS